MAYTALHEHYGSSRVVQIYSDWELPLPKGPGLARVVAVTPRTGGLRASLPDARRLAIGGPHYLVMCELDTLDVTDVDGDTVISVLAGRAAEIYLVDNSTAKGGWISRTSTFSKGSPLAANRQPVSHTFKSSRITVPALLEAPDWGWDGESPIALTLTVPNGVVIGSVNEEAALWVGGFPEGSTLLLQIEEAGYISGRGGNGGNGGTQLPGLGPTAGADGGLALLLGIDTTLVSYGFLQGGGGGGGGGEGSSTAGGGGGGGGAGYAPSLGGQPGAGGGAFPGVSGQLTIAGGGGLGGYSGGTAGTPGVAGSAGDGAAGAGTGGAGGAAGDAVQYLSTVSWTKLRAGTIRGSEVAI